MEGLIPFLYRAIVQYKSGKQQPGWFCDSPSATTYMRLPGDSGRFSQIFRSEYNLSVTASSLSSSGNNRNLGNNNNNKVAATTQVIVETSDQSPVCRVKTLRAVA